jgi:NADH-quinone oxidoreductase subunit C
MSAVVQIKARFNDKIEVWEKSSKRIYVTVGKADIREILSYLFIDLRARFSTASGVDVREGIEILYHMAFDQEGVVVTVRTLAPKPEPEMPSIADFCPAANWLEREIHEMLGVKFSGHPNLETLLLPDDWPKGVYPLRKKSFESEKED